MIFAAVVLFGTAVTVMILSLQLDSPLNIAESLDYEVQRGATVTSIAHDVEQYTDVDPLFFRVYARVTSGAGNVKAGEYKLQPGMSSKNLLALFRSGKVIQRTITFPEGWTFLQWRARLAESADVRQTIQGLTDFAVMKALGQPRLFPEGQFFPDTYAYVKNESDLEILRRANAKMKTILAKEWQRRATGDALVSQQDALVLASIIEKETGAAADRGMIARVFVNRLDRDMKLQSDPTVIYGLGAEFDGDLKRRHLREDQPYNSYFHKGLPPPPICSPGLESIRAALDPDPGDFLYFVARGDGGSYFSTSLEEHNRAVNRFQRRVQKNQ